VDSRRARLNRSLLRARAGVRALRADPVLPGPTAGRAPLEGIYLGNGLLLTRHPYGGPMFVDARDLTVTPRILTGEYEPDLARLLPSLVRGGDLVLDIGANQGFHTITMASGVGPAGHVVSFEPNPRTADVLEKNVMLSGLRQLVTIERVAASDRAGSASFRALEHEPAGSHLLAAAQEWTAALPHELLEVEMVDIGAFAAGLPRPPRLVKIDAEGHDIHVLERLLSTLPPDPERVYIVEIIPGLIEGGPQRLLDLMAREGLHAFAFSGRPGPAPVDGDYLSTVSFEDLVFTYATRLP
jgi:FkbM family methyltransferase